MIATKKNTATSTSPNAGSGATLIGVTFPKDFWNRAAAIRPGRNLPRAGLALLVLSLIYFAFPTSVLWSLIVIATIGLVVASAFEVRLLHRQFHHLRIRRTLPVVIGRDAPFSVGWDVENQGLSSIHGEIRDVVPATAQPELSIQPMWISEVSRESLSIVHRIPNRGHHKFGPIWVRLAGPRGLMEMQNVFDVFGAIKVLPEQFASRDELMKDRGAELLLLDKATRTRQHGAGTEFESLHEFREGDDPRRIDWRATARLQHPIVRRFQIERHRDVMILVDCGRLMGTETDRGTKLDCAIDAALILARVVLQSGDRCGMALYDSDVKGYLPPVSGLNSLHSIVDSVFAAQSQFHESNFGPMFATLQSRQSKRSLIVVLSDVADAETSEQFRASLVRLGRRHVVLFAALRTPLLNTLLQEPVRNMIDGAKKAVTFRLLKERQLTIQSLKHGGVFVLDVEPSQLTVPLVNQFIELRQKNVL